MKIIVRPRPIAFELTSEQLCRLREISKEENYYWTSGRDGELLDELHKMGLVHYGQDEIYHLTGNGQLVIQQLK